MHILSWRRGKGCQSALPHLQPVPTWRQCDASLYATIAGGIPGTQMGAFGTTLSQEEILSIIAFLRAETRRRQEAGELDQ